MAKIEKKGNIGEIVKTSILNVKTPLGGALLQIHEINNNNQTMKISLLSLDEELSF